MPAKVRCDRCGKQYAAPASMAGKRIRCRQCGNTIAVPLHQTELIQHAPLPLDEPPIVLAPAPSAVDRSPPPSVRVRPKPAPPPPEEEPTELSADDIHHDDPTAAAIGVVDDDALLDESPPLQPMLPANGLYDFPGSGLIDQALPWTLVVIGLAWLIHDSAITGTEDHPLIGYLRASIYLLFYAAIVFPITRWSVSTAVQSQRFGMPSAGGWRVFAAFFLPFVFAVVLWLVTGTIGSLTTGLLVGLLPGLGALWLLLRLQPYQLVGVLSRAAGGFLIAMVLAAGLFVGIAFMLMMGMRSTPHTFQQNPLGPGLMWQPPAPPAPKPASPTTEHPATLPALNPTTEPAAQSTSATLPAIEPPGTRPTSNPSSFWFFLQHR